MLGIGGLLLVAALAGAATPPDDLWLTSTSEELLLLTTTPVAEDLLTTAPPEETTPAEGKLLSETLSFPLSPIVNATTAFIKSPRMAFGKNSFLTGFGLGFLAFGLKKLLLPLFIGAQIVKSVLVALFLPTILSGIGKLVGKGLTNVASQSGSSGSHDQVGEFEFKDPAGYDAEPQGSDTIGTWAAPSQAHATLAALNGGRNPAVTYYGTTAGGAQPTQASAAQIISERYTPKLPSLPMKHTGSFYSKDPTQDYKAYAYRGGVKFHIGQYFHLTVVKTSQGRTLNVKVLWSLTSEDEANDTKVFQKIPSSSHLLTHYDPFYSPLLSRLDSVYQQLGTTSEGCRERLVCDMYSNPAKFAPFSNLVSAQLSRELNELRKPSSDNPEILRFFRYMKSAKDGQDGARCDLVHNNCIAPTTLSDGSPMVTTFNDINKLVQARALKVT